MPDEIQLPSGHPLVSALLRPIYIVDVRGGGREIVGPSGEGWMDPETCQSDEELLDQAIATAVRYGAEKVVRQVDGQPDCIIWENPYL